MVRPVSWVAVGWKLGAGRLSVRAAGYRIVLYSLQPGHLPSLPAPNFQPTATQETGRPIW